VILITGGINLDKLVRHRRLAWLAIILCLCFTCIGARLFYIQVVRGPELARQAVQQRTLGIEVIDGRGDIIDRNGSSLLDKGKEGGLIAFPVQYRGSEHALIESLAPIGHLAKITDPPYGPHPFWLATSIDNRIDMTTVMELPGVLYANRTRRYGPDTLASHIIGYVQESEGRGVSGIELAFDRELSRGQRREIAALVDGKNRLVPGLGYRVMSEPGRPLNVQLSLDSTLQRLVEQVMDRRVARGAVVVMDPWNGDILAMASRPDFKAYQLEKYLKNEDEALLNRALLDYQPGSVFKTVVAAAALEEGLTGLFDTYYCSGGIEVDGRFFPCSRLHEKAQITLVDAFAHSCNSVFIELALKLGPHKLHFYARKMGLGTGTGLPVGEKEGNLPAVEDLVNPRALANTAIGQGDLQATPVQLARMLSLIANGGRMVEPRLVVALRDEDGRIVRNFVPRRGEQVFSQVTVQKLKYLLQVVVDEGTARDARTDGLLLGAKTGTAESGRRTADGREIFNYWIAGIYPLERSKAVIIVFADRLKYGSVSAVFGEIVSIMNDL
jgi:penicillin-binding protein 2